MLPTVAEESTKSRLDITPERRDPRVDTLSQRLADSHEEDRQRNLARQSGQPYEAEAPRKLTADEEARALVHDLGLANTPESHRFILRYLALEKRVAELDEFYRFATRR